MSDFGTDPSFEKLPTDVDICMNASSLICTVSWITTSLNESQGSSSDSQYNAKVRSDTQGLLANDLKGQKIKRQFWRGQQWTILLCICIKVTGTRNDSGMLAWKQLHCHVLFFSSFLFYFFYGIHGWSDSISKGCFSPALCWLSAGGPGGDSSQVSRSYLLECVRLPAAHAVSECDRAAHPTRCANHKLLPTVCIFEWAEKEGDL